MSRLFRIPLGTALLAFLLPSCGNGFDPNELSPRSAPGDRGTSGENQILALSRGHSKQTRPTLIWDARLTQAARARAKDMGNRKYFNHVDPDGHGPNWHISSTGYRLPLKWTAFPKANQVESILAGQASAQVAFQQWMNSPKHANHILARNSFYSNQTHIGVGYAFVPNSPFKHYWVFLSAPPER